MSEFAKDILLAYTEANSQEIIWYDAYYLDLKDNCDYYCGKCVDGAAKDLGLTASDIVYHPNPDSDSTLFCEMCGKLLLHVPTSYLAQNELDYWLEEMTWPPSPLNCAVLHNILDWNCCDHGTLSELLDKVLERVNQETR